VTRLGTGRLGFDLPGRDSNGNISVRHRLQTGSVVHSASYPMGMSSLLPGGKETEREANHSPPYSAEVKNEWSYASSTPILLHSVVLI